MRDDQDDVDTTLDCDRGVPYNNGARHSRWQIPHTYMQTALWKKFFSLYYKHILKKPCHGGKYWLTVACEFGRELAFIWYKSNETV